LSPREEPGGDPREEPGGEATPEPDRRWPDAGRLRAGARASLLAGARGFVLSVLSLCGSLTLFVLGVVSIALIAAAGLGLFLAPPVLALIRRHAGRRRALAREWAGVTIRSPYRELPARRGPLRLPRQCVALLGDRATWRDLGWLPVDAVAGCVSALLPAALVVYAAEGLLIAAGLWTAVRGGYWYAFVLVRGFGSALVCGVLACALAVVAFYANPRLLRGHFLLAARMIGPSRGARLEQRVERLYETRHDAVDSSAAELRRIERDLHDGAQARLVSVGMSLGTVEALIEKDPEQARKLLAQARQSSAEALDELRDLVRGIHPPVLAERGLGDAVRALALRMQPPVEADVEVPGRFPEPVESAAYFAVSEVLANAAKHAQASRIRLDMHHTASEGGRLRIAVTDDGRGGADPDNGTGLQGVRRRLGPFDGVLAVSSPHGGPTTVTMEIPCTPNRPNWPACTPT